MKQKIVIFYEKCDDTFDLPSKIASIFFNLSSINEENQFEIASINEIENIDKCTILPIMKSAIESSSNTTHIHFVFGLRYFYRYALIDQAEGPPSVMPIDSFNQLVYSL